MIALALVLGSLSVSAAAPARTGARASPPAVEAARREARPVEDARAGSRSGEDAPREVQAQAHGKLAWFDGGFDAALAAAGREGRLVFLDFWTDWCTWCKVLDRETFSDERVVARMRGLVCLSVDAESEAGRALAARFSVAAFPALVFLDADGTPRDRIDGFLPPPAFLAEVARVERDQGTLRDLRARVDARPDDLLLRLELAGKARTLGLRELSAAQVERVGASIERGEGFDPRSVDARWRLHVALRGAGAEEIAAAQMRAIRELDPEGRSIVLRRLKLGELVRAMREGYLETGAMDSGPVERFLADEREPELLFSGWEQVHDAHVYLAEEARKRENEEARVAHRAKARAAAREATKSCPKERVGAWGKYAAYVHWQDEEDLSDVEKAFAVDAARAAYEAEPASADHADMLACALAMAGKVDEARAVLEKALEREPGNASLRERLAEIGR